MFVCVVSLSQPSSRVVINVFGICYMLNVCLRFATFSQPSSRDLVYPLWDGLYPKQDLYKKIRDPLQRNPNLSRNITVTTGHRD